MCTSVLGVLNVTSVFGITILIGLWCWSLGLTEGSMALGSSVTAIGSVRMGFGSTLMGFGSTRMGTGGSTRIGAGSTLIDFGSTLMGKGSALMGVGSALIMGVDSIGVVVSIGSLVDFGVVTTGACLMGLGTIGIGFSIELTGFPVGSGVGIGLITDGIDGDLTTRGSRS